MGIPQVKLEDSIASRCTIYRNGCLGNQEVCLMTELFTIIRGRDNYLGGR